MADLKQVLPGDPLRISAAEWNEVLSAVRAWKGARGGASSAVPLSLPIHPSLTCLVKYDASSTLTLPVHSIVTLADLIPDLSGTDGDPHGVNRRPAYVAGVPSGPTAQVAVTLEPIQGGQLGRAALAGHVVATVNVTDTTHTRAVPIASSTAKLASAAAGGYPVVFKESGTGDVMAVVDLGPASGGREVFVASLDTTPAPDLWTRRTLDAAGAWVADSGGLSLAATVPVPIGGGSFAAADDAYCLVWPEASGKFGYLPIQYASVTRDGYVSPAAQTFGGDKTFVDDVTVGVLPAGTSTLQVYGEVQVDGVPGDLNVANDGQFGGDVGVVGAVDCSSFSCDGAGSYFTVDGAAVSPAYPFEFGKSGVSGPHVTFRVDSPRGGDPSSAWQLTFQSKVIAGLWRLETQDLEVNDTADFTNEATFHNQIRCPMYAAERVLPAENAYAPSPLVVGLAKYDLGGTLSKTVGGTTYMLFSKGIYVGGTGAAGTPTVVTGTAGSGGSSGIDAVLTALGGVTGTFNSGTF